MQDAREGRRVIYVHACQAKHRDQSPKQGSFGHFLASLTQMWEQGLPFYICLSLSQRLLYQLDRLIIVFKG